MTEEKVICDVCKDREKKISCHDFKMTVVFTTEQDEGRATEHYLDTKTLDLCLDCRARVISGEMIFAQGAMGHNEYYFKRID